jgi:hypothetical protein
MFRPRSARRPPASRGTAPRWLPGEAGMRPPCGPVAAPLPADQCSGTAKPLAHEIPRWVPPTEESSPDRPEVTPKPQVAANGCAADL